MVTIKFALFFIASSFLLLLTAIGCLGALDVPHSLFDNHFHNGFFMGGFALAFFYQKGHNWIYYVVGAFGVISPIHWFNEDAPIAAYLLVTIHLSLSLICVTTKNKKKHYFRHYITMKLSTLMFALGILVCTLLVANALRCDVAMSADSAMIYREVQDKLRDKHYQDVIEKGSLIGFFKTYKLKYIAELNAYEFEYSDPMTCIEIKIQARRESSDQKSNTINDIIAQCESNNRLLIT